MCSLLYLTMPVACGTRLSAGRCTTAKYIGKPWQWLLAHAPSPFYACRGNKRKAFTVIHCHSSVHARTFIVYLVCLNMAAVCA